MENIHMLLTQWRNRQLQYLFLLYISLIFFTFCKFILSNSLNTDKMYCPSTPFIRN